MKSEQKIFIEHLSCFSLLTSILKFGKSAKYYYFYKTEKVENCAQLLCRLHCLKEMPRELFFSFSEFKDETGKHLFEKINQDIIHLAKGIVENIPSEFYKTFTSLVDEDRLKLFFYKVIADQMYESVIFLHASQRTGDKDSIYVISSSASAKALKAYAVELGLKPVVFINLRHSVLMKWFGRFFGKKSLLKNKFGSNFSFNVPKAPISVWYTGKTLGTDTSKRNELSWLMAGNISPKDCLLYFERKNVLPSEQGLKNVFDQGVQLGSFFKFETPVPIALFKSGDLYSRKIKEHTKNMALAWLKSFTAFKPVHLFFLERMMWFIQSYARWLDFFVKSETKIHIYQDYMNPIHIAINQALRHQGGVNVSYQWSNLHFNSVVLSLDTDVLFTFSPMYKKYFKDSGSIVRQFVSTGYPTDTLSDALKSSAAGLREKLQKAGAKFIICYLDENSSDDRLSIIPNNKARDIYAFWLKAILQDRTLGLILKPGYIHDFDARIRDPIKEIFQQAQATGRCIIVNDGHFKTDTLPAEVAKASDLTIGLLLAGTTALEASLSKVPVVFLDVEGLTQKEIYTWGDGKVVFNSCESLYKNLKQFRLNQSSVSGFGDLSRWIEDKDLFKDGEGALRISQYIQWLLEGLNQYKDSGKALIYAEERYLKHWGNPDVPSKYQTVA